MLSAPPSTPAERIDIERYDFGLPLHPLCKISPLLSPDELADLAENIKAIGLRRPLTLYKDGSLLDGKNRLIACKMAGVEPRFETLPDHRDPRDFFISVSVLRQNWNPSQRAVLAATVHLSSGPNPELPRANRTLVEMAIYILQHAPSYVEPLCSGVRGVAEVYKQVHAEQDEADRRAEMLADLRAAAPDLAAILSTRTQFIKAPVWLAGR